MKPTKKEIEDIMLKDLNDFMKDFDIEEISFGKTHKIKRTQDEKAENIVYKKQTVGKLSVYEVHKLGDNKCWYCGDDLFESTKTVDHFWPKSMGGRLKVACCASCNKMKKNLTPNGFINLLQSLKTKHPDYQPWQKRFDRMINATQTLWERVKWSI